MAPVVVGAVTARSSNASRRFCSISVSHAGNVCHSVCSARRSRTADEPSRKRSVMDGGTVDFGRGERGTDAVGAARDRGVRVAAWVRSSAANCAGGICDVVMIPCVLIFRIAFGRGTRYFSGGKALSRVIIAPQPLCESTGAPEVPPARSRVAACWLAVSANEPPLAVSSFLARLSLSDWVGHNTHMSPRVDLAIF